MDEHRQKILEAILSGYAGVLSGGLSGEGCIE